MCIHVEMLNLNLFPVKMEIILCYVISLRSLSFIFIFASYLLLKDENNSEYPVSSEEIENKYLHDREQQFHFIHEGRTYFIDFKEMFQTNGEKRAVIRRPLFFKEKNIEENAM